MTEKKKKAPNKLKASKRFKLISLAICLFGLLVLGKALKTMLTEDKYWSVVREQFTILGEPDKAMRGNLYDCNGKLLVGSVPEYRLYVDFQVTDKNDTLAAKRGQHVRDSIFLTQRDAICEGLADIFPEYDKQYFYNQLTKGFVTRNRACRIYPHNATYIQMQEVKKLPMFCESKIKGGFYPQTIPQRKKPYGTIAGRVLGTLQPDSGIAKSGLEACYDTILQGTDGITHWSKVRNKQVQFYDVKAVNGHDLMTTIDIDIQDVADKALRRELEYLRNMKLGTPDMGVAIVLEAATGDVKAMVNLCLKKDGTYDEVLNAAITQRMEPGSTFKTASIMAALEDGRIKRSDKVDCAPGKIRMHGCNMIDHNYSRGGYQTLTVDEVLMYSSNIGVSKLIDEHYKDDPENFIAALKREGMGIPLGLPFSEKFDPLIKDPKTSKSWSKASLPWISIGYESLIPPISTVAFYNGIANNGKMMRPRFVKAEMENDVVVREFAPVVLREQMASPQTIKDIQEILHRVVADGLGSKAHSNKGFEASGKTGTAQIAAEGGGGYHNKRRYLVSFCGFFPSDNPKYTCLVCIRKPGSPASGGGMCGPVFREISEFVMAHGNYRDLGTAADSTSVFTANVKATMDNSTMQQGTMPDLTGLGARDALFALQKLGIKGRLNGTGSVVSQSVKPGIAVEKGITVELILK